MMAPHLPAAEERRQRTRCGRCFSSICTRGNPIYLCSSSTGHHIIHMACTATPLSRVLGHQSLSRQDMRLQEDRNVLPGWQLG